VTFYTALRDRIPTWGYDGPWPFELGIAGVLLWLGEAFSHAPAQLKLFNGAPFRLFDWLASHSIPFSLILSVIAGIITVGFVLRARAPRASKTMRIAGMVSASLIFGVIAYSFLSAFSWSMGGICYAFIAWRTATVAAVHMRRVSRHANESA